jgi:hypothetical protein
MGRPTAASKLPVLAAGEWLMVLPAVVFFAAAVLRGLQPSQYEPARTSLIVFEWFAQVPHAVLALLLIGLLGIVVIVGCATVLRIWRKDQTLRNDARSALAILRRRLDASLLTAATLLAAAILAVIAAHMVTD